MARVRMYHASSDSYQFASDAAFTAVHQHEGWVLAPEVDEAPAAEPVAEAAADDEPAVAEPPKRGRSK